MSRPVSMLLAAVFLFCTHRSFDPAGAAEPRLEVGRTFPELRLPALSAGGAATVSSFRGRKLLLLVYASW